jgi:hypothetical protein
MVTAHSLLKGSLTGTRHPPLGLWHDTKLTESVISERRLVVRNANVADPISEITDAINFGTMHQQLICTAVCVCVPVYKKVVTSTDPP